MVCGQVIGRYGVLDKAFKHLVSRSPAQFWTSGQWMTERKGGSDVGLYVRLSMCVLNHSGNWGGNYIGLCSVSRGGEDAPSISSL